MSGLRSLGVCYLAAASVFTTAATVTAHRAAFMALDRRVNESVVRPALALLRGESGGASVSIAIAPPGLEDVRNLAHVALAPLPRKPLAARAIAPIAIPVVIAPDLPALPDVRAQAQARPSGGRAMVSDAQGQPSYPQAGAENLTPDQRRQVADRLRETLTPELVANFNLFLYVTKANSGPLAQRLYVFKKARGGALQLAYDWPASTGRERHEVTPGGRRTFTGTPAGLYELDPHRMYVHYRSHAWDQTMPYSMFFNWESNGLETGLAIHAASGADIAKLGSRASAGCVHISPEHARLLYNMIRADYRGPAPRFAYDRRTQTMSNQGELVRDAHGRLIKAQGFTVLVDIDDFGGGNVVAALD